MSTKTKKPRTPKMSKSAARAEGAAKAERLRKAALAEIKDRLDGKPHREGSLTSGLSPLHPAEPPESPGQHRLRRRDGEGQRERRRQAVKVDRPTTAHLLADLDLERLRAADEVPWPVGVVRRRDDRHRFDVVVVAV
ncbi:MAG: hypothetical protein IT438_01265, partial [Phycisphaerales bacterium]|nr:hypothetical protein [Phycisphaerales bacterium]